MMHQPVTTAIPFFEAAEKGLVPSDDNRYAGYDTEFKDGRIVRVGRNKDGTGERLFTFRRQLPNGQQADLTFALSREASVAVLLSLIRCQEDDNRAASVKPLAPKPEQP